MPPVGMTRLPPPIDAPAVPSSPENGTASGDRLAVNLFDMELLHPTLRQRFLPLFDLSGAFKVSDGKDGRAIAFGCPLLTATMACDVLQSERRREGDEPLRVYLRRDGVWRRLPANAVFTEVDVDGTVILNHVIFPWAFVPAPDVPPPPPEPVTF